MNKFPISCIQITSSACIQHILPADISCMQATSPACRPHLLPTDVSCMQTTSPACRHFLHADHIFYLQATSPACRPRFLHADHICCTYDLSRFREEYRVRSPSLYTLQLSSVKCTLCLRRYVHMLTVFSTTPLIMSYISCNCQF